MKINFKKAASASGACRCLFQGERSWVMGHSRGAAVALAALILLGCASGAAAEESEIGELNRKVEILTEEVEKLKLGGVAEDSYESYSGLGPAASKVYGLKDGLSIGGYGEIFYASYGDDTKKDLADTLRFILYSGYKFTDRIILNAEIEFEHANEVFVEFAYIDFLIDPAFNLRPGLLLVPFGITNEMHEPTVYNGVQRPEVERNIIPTTWRDIGIMAHGEAGGLAYKAAVLNGMKSDGFRKADWIRNGRYKGTSANAENLAYVVNLEYEVAGGLTAGGSYYFGGSGTGAGGSEVEANEKKADVSLWEMHALYKRGGLDLRGLYVEGRLDGNDAFEAAPPGSVGKKVKGWYAEAAYDVMPHIRPMTEMSLSPFVRYEDYDTHAGVFSGPRDASQHRLITTVGLGFKPVQNVVIKADYQMRDTDSSLPSGKGAGLDENKIDQLNLGVGFIF